MTSVESLSSCLMTRTTVNANANITKPVAARKTGRQAIAIIITRLVVVVERYVVQSTQCS